MSKNDYASEISSIEFKFSTIDNRYELTSSEGTIETIGHGIRTYPGQIEELERRGFLHTRPLKNMMASAKSGWTREQEREARQELSSLKKKLLRERSKVNAQLKRLDRPSNSLIERAEAGVAAFEDSVSAAESYLRMLTSSTSAEIGRAAYQMGRINWMLEQIGESPDITLLENEGPLLAVEAEWENEGDEGPDGILYLTDQRLIFEEKAEKVTRRFLFITRESELIQQLLIDEPVSGIQEISHSEERRRLIQFRKDDLLEFIMSGHAAHSRLRFHVKGQESKDWATMINRVMDGDVFKDRSKAAQSDEADVRQKSFPTDCPDCLAPIPPQPRGALNVTCEFCNSTVQAV